MTLPTFLGIGVPRAGTTWLHTLLSSHPDVYMPTRRKEVRFFDRDYERGLDWYQTFFPSPEEAIEYQAIGEISPQYYQCERGPERISAALPESKLMVMLRHPVSRAYSNYGFNIQRWNYKGSFEEYLAAKPRMLERGFYSRYLRRYLRHFDKTQILALVFEDVFDDIPKTKSTIANFLEIPVDGFPSTIPGKKVNASTVPTFRSVYGFAVKMSQKLKKRQLHSVVDFVRRLGVERILSKGSALPPLDQELKRHLSRSYRAEFDALEQCLQIDLSCWRS